MQGARRLQFVEDGFGTILRTSIEMETDGFGTSKGDVYMFRLLDGDFGDVARLPLAYGSLRPEWHLDT